MRRARVVVLICVALLLSGCSSKSDYYRLNPPVSKSTKSISSGRVIGIASVDLADYLDKNQIVIRQDSAKMEIEETKEWVGSLSKNIQSFITESLNSKIKSYTFLTFPWEEPIEDRYRIYIAIDRFDSDSNGTATLSGRWSIVNKRYDRFVYGKRFLYSRSGGSELHQIVSTQSSLLQRLSDDIASALRRRFRIY